MTLAPAVIKDMAACAAYRISPKDTNYFALVFDPQGDRADLVAVIEIFAPGGRTPPNSHARAHEMFFVLEGTGRALCGDIARDFAKGDAILLRPGATHEIVNTGTGKLYTLTVMVPNEDLPN
jgi:mannose-6-phosphate isomerase-like protein (cupin superfamily)